MKTKHLIVLLFLAFTLSACVSNVNINECLDGKTYGFWGGLWHGIIAPIDLVAMIFNSKYAVFATNNNGAWYAFGFILGSGGWGFLGSRGRRRKECKE